MIGFKDTIASDKRYCKQNTLSRNGCGEAGYSRVTSVASKPSRDRVNELVPIPGQLVGPCRRNCAFEVVYLFVVTRDLEEALIQRGGRESNDFKSEAILLLKNKKP